MHILSAKVLTLVLTATLLASCNLMNLLDPPKINDPILSGRGANFCEIAKPIFWAPDGADTKDTVAQIKEHNAVGKKLCGWGVTLPYNPPPPTAF